MTPSRLPDPRAAGALGAALRRAGYTEAAIQELLGDDAYGHDRGDGPLDDRRLPRTPLAALVRAFFVQLPVPRGEVARALGRRGLEALHASGLVPPGETVAAATRILPVGELLIASDDSLHASGRDDPPDYVAAYTPTSRLLDCLTPRRRVARALDVGCGSGVQALLAARHARHVVATDVNPRALAYTAFNAALNGIANVECRRGSLFEPVEGERFGLITCNPPYVVSPEHRFAYRDSGLRGDEISERVVAGAAAHLADGGFATMTASWVARGPDDADDRALAWTAATGCDAWILSASEADPLRHAADWNGLLVDEPDRFGAALDAWTAYLGELGVGWVSEGAIVLHRRPGRRSPTRVDAVDADRVEAAGAQVERAFAARARLAALRRPDELLGARLAPAMRLELGREVGPRRAGGARVRLLEGTHAAVSASAEAVAVLERLDGRSTLRAALVRTSARGRRDALRLVRELLALGALRFAG